VGWLFLKLLWNKAGIGNHAGGILDEICPTVLQQVDLPVFHYTKDSSTADHHQNDCLLLNIWSEDAYDHEEQAAEVLNVKLDAVNSS
jgi:hypothetical protein